jgi:D-alanine transaminase
MMRPSGIALSVQKDERWDKCFIKTVCLLPAIWAKQAAVDAGAFEALLLRDGIVTEGASTNIFCVINGDLHTHPEGEHILSGVTRSLVLEVARSAGIKVVERAVPLEDFLAADEAFVSSTTLDVMPVSRVDAQQIGSGEAGPVTRAVAAGVLETISQEVFGR